MEESVWTPTESVWIWSRLDTHGVGLDTHWGDWSRFGHPSLEGASPLGILDAFWTSTHGSAHSWERAPHTLQTT